MSKNAVYIRKQMSFLIWNPELEWTPLGHGYPGWGWLLQMWGGSYKRSEQIPALCGLLTLMRKGTGKGRIICTQVLFANSLTPEEKSGKVKRSLGWTFIELPPHGMKHKEWERSISSHPAPSTHAGPLCMTGISLPSTFPYCVTYTLCYHFFSPSTCLHPVDWDPDGTLMTIHFISPQRAQTSSSFYPTKAEVYLFL